MIGYICLGSNDLERSNAFFDPLFAALGGTRAYSLDNLSAWGFGEGKPMIMVTRPYDGHPASVGNGSMVALRARDAAQVDEVHALALSLGATDEGPAGPRGDRFHAGYFRDPDGTKFNVFVMG